MLAAAAGGGSWGWQLGVAGIQAFVTCCCTGQAVAGTHQNNKYRIGAASTACTAGCHAHMTDTSWVMRSLVGPIQTAVILSVSPS